MKTKILPVIAAAVAAAAVLTVLFVPKGEKQADVAGKTERIANSITEEPVKSTEKTDTAQTDTIDITGDIEIKLDDLSTDSAAVLNYELDGTEMGLLAIKDDEENIYIAFNTCQVCNGSPLAYFEQVNGKLVCQNCGNRFDLSSIGSSSMGCNPITISNDYFTETDEGIVISKEFFNANKELFSNWKKL